MNQKIGELGEELVLRYEQEKLKMRGSTKQPEWISVNSDGGGYDIKSYDENDAEIYIEVKTTTQNCERDFFITATELETSIKFKERFRLYRVYNFDVKKQTAKFKEHKGSLENLCVNPIVYRVKVEEDVFAPSAQIRG